MISGGLFAALVTPYTKAGEVDYRMVKRLVRYLISQDIQGFYVCGSSGESFLLTDFERQSILEAVCEENNGDKPVICHCGALSTRQTLVLAKHAVRTGIDAISSIPPIFFKYTQQEIVDYYKELAVESGVPVVVYNFPDQVGFPVTAGMIQEMTKAASNIIGIKHTSTDLFQLERMKTQNPHLLIFNGYDEILLSGICAGADGAIGSTFNAIPKVYLRVMEAFENGDIPTARAYQTLANDFIQILMKNGVLVSIKAYLECEGIMCNGSRKPFSSILEDTVRHELSVYHKRYIKMFES